MDCLNTGNMQKALTRLPVESELDTPSGTSIKAALQKRVKCPVQGPRDLCMFTSVNKEVHFCEL